MTPKEVRDRVDFIRGIAGDDEAAHVTEDELYADVLRAIAAGRCRKAAELAQEALKTQDIEFARWCA